MYFQKIIMEQTEENILALLNKGANSWNSWIEDLKKNVHNIKLRSDKSLRNYQAYQISFSIATFPKMKFGRSVFTKYNFSRLKIQSSEFDNVEFNECNFFETQFNNSIFKKCVFNNCSFKKTYFIDANLSSSTFNNCMFIGSNLSKTNQYQTTYHNCTLLYTYLMFAHLVETYFYKSTIDSCKIYGVSTWGIKVEDSISKNLIITKHSDADSEISVDNIEIAQHIYMLIDNKKIRNLITTLTSKVILILGRFTDARLDILEAIKDNIRNQGYIPMLFTFTPSTNRDLIETIFLMASISRMVFADITDPSSVSHEISEIVKNFPSLTVQPLLFDPVSDDEEQEEVKEYATIEHFKNYTWFKNTFKYYSKSHLTSKIKTLIN